MSPLPGFRLFGSEFPGLPLPRGLNYFDGHRDTWATERSQSIITIGSAALSQVEDQVIILDQSIFCQTADVSTPRKDQRCDSKQDLKRQEITWDYHYSVSRQNVTLDKSFPWRKVSRIRILRSHRSSCRHFEGSPLLQHHTDCDEYPPPLLDPTTNTKKRSLAVWYISEGFPLLQKIVMKIPHISTSIAKNIQKKINNLTQKSIVLLLCWSVCSCALGCFRFALFQKSNKFIAVCTPPGCI